MKDSIFHMGIILKKEAFMAIFRTSKISWDKFTIIVMICYLGLFLLAFVRLPISCPILRYPAGDEYAALLASVSVLFAAKQYLDGKNKDRDSAVEAEKAKLNEVIQGFTGRFRNLHGKLWNARLDSVHVGEKFAFAYELLCLLEEEKAFLKSRAKVDSENTNTQKSEWQPTALVALSEIKEVFDQSGDKNPFNVAKENYIKRVDSVRDFFNEKN